MKKHTSVPSQMSNVYTGKKSQTHPLALNQGMSLAHFNGTMKSAIRFGLASAVACVLLSSPLAYAKGGSEGGGNGTAAEIQRATDEFIRMVRDNPAKFPGVNPDQLAAIDADIRLTGKKIQFCDGSGDLDAVSANNQSTFNLPTWRQKSWAEKVQLAGHERLVLAQLEPSNRYSRSNKVFEIARADQEKELGPAKDICAFGPEACRSREEIDALIDNDIVAMNDGAVSRDEAQFLLDQTKQAIKAQINMVIGLKAVEIDKRWIKRGGDEELAKYSKAVNLAYEAHYRPLFLEAQNTMDDKDPAPACVQVSGAPDASASLKGAARDVNRMVASAMPQGHGANRQVTTNSQKPTESVATAEVTTASTVLAGSAK
jgi:hypothetical protein